MTLLLSLHLVFLNSSNEYGGTNLRRHKCDYLEWTHEEIMSTKHRNIIHDAQCHENEEVC